MTKISIEVALADLGLVYDEDGDLVPGATLQDQIVSAIVERLGAAIEGDVRMQVEAVVNQRILAVVDPLIQEIASGPIQLRARWGDKVGEPTTLREIVRGHVEAFMNKPLTRDAWGRERDPQSLPDIAAIVTKDVLTKELASEVHKARAEVSDTVKNTIIAETVKILNGTR